MKDVNEIRPDLPLLLEETARPGLLNRIEWERFREYLIAHDIGKCCQSTLLSASDACPAFWLVADLVRILKEVAHLAQEQLEHPTNLVSSASVVGGTNGTQPPEDQGTRAESAEGRSGEQAQVEAAGGEVSSGPRLVLSANQQELFRTLRNTHYGMWHRLAMHHWCKGCMGAAVIKAGIVAWWIVEREKGLVPGAVHLPSFGRHAQSVVKIRSIPLTLCLLPDPCRPPDESCRLRGRHTVQ